MQKFAKCSCNDKNVEPNNYDLPLLICRLFANVKYFHSGGDLQCIKAHCNNCCALIAHWEKKKVQIRLPLNLEQENSRDECT